MRFENFEVQQAYCELCRKYGVSHVTPADRNKKITFDDLEVFEKDFKTIADIISTKNK